MRVGQKNSVQHRVNYACIYISTVTGSAVQDSGHLMVLPVIVLTQEIAGYDVASTSKTYVFLVLQEPVDGNNTYTLRYSLPAMLDIYGCYARDAVGTLADLNVLMQVRIRLEQVTSTFCHYPCGSCRMYHNIIW